MQEAEEISLNYLILNIFHHLKYKINKYEVVETLFFLILFINWKFSSWVLLFYYPFFKFVADQSAASFYKCRCY